MKRHVLSLSLAAVTAAAMLTSKVSGAASPPLPGVDATNPNQWDEHAYQDSTGGTLPAPLPGNSYFESFQGTPSNGFSFATYTEAAYTGRTIGTAGLDVTTNLSGTTALYNISSGLFKYSDARLYEINITSPATFTAASQPGPADGDHLIISIYDAAGHPIVAESGGASPPSPADGYAGLQLNSSNDNITTPGLYWIAISDPFAYPQDDGSHPLFSGLASGTTAGTNIGVFNPVDPMDTLSTDPTKSFALTYAFPTTGSSNTAYLTATTGGNGVNQDTIALTGTSFAVVPEPTSLGLLGALSLGLLARRRRSDRTGA